MNSSKNQENKLEDVESKFRSGFALRYGLLIVTILLFIVFAIFIDDFISFSNFFNIMRMASLTGILALGLTTIVIAGEFDIAFAPNATFVGVVVVLMIIAGVPLIYTLLAGAAMAIAVAVAQAFAINKFGVPAFLVALAMQLVLQGGALGLTGGSPQWPAQWPAFMVLIGKARIFGIIPFPVITFLVVGVILTYLLDYTTFGRKLYSVGGSPEAAYHVGIRLKRMKYIAFAIAGVTYAIAGITGAASFGSGEAGQMAGYILLAILSTFLGSVFLMEGSVPNPRGTMIAAFTIALINNGLQIAGLRTPVIQVVLGAIIIVTVLVIGIVKRKRYRLLEEGLSEIADARHQQQAERID